METKSKFVKEHWKRQILLKAGWSLNLIFGRFDKKNKDFVVHREDWAITEEQIDGALVSMREVIELFGIPQIGSDVFICHYGVVRGVDYNCEEKRIEISISDF